MGLVCSALPALAMEAWNNQQGGNKYQVIFDGKIYENAWWVSSTNCPGKAKANDATNPWRLKRTATAGNDSNLLIVFYVQIMPDDFVMQLHRF